MTRLTDQVGGTLTPAIQETRIARAKTVNFRMPVVMACPVPNYGAGKRPMRSPPPTPPTQISSPTWMPTVPRMIRSFDG